MRIIHKNLGIILLDCSTLGYSGSDHISTEYMTEYTIVNRNLHQITLTHEELLIISMYFKNSRFNLF